MDERLEVCNIVVIALTGWVSYRGLRDSAFLDKFIFEPARILRDKQYYRIVTSGFLHGDLMHFLFNMFSLYAFGRYIEAYFGVGTFLLIYFAGMVGGNILSLYLHRHHEYRALGASGGVCGVIYASIFLLPGGEIYIFFIPFGIPSAVYAILFLFVSFMGMRSQAGNIGHDAHLGGALVGLLTATAMYPYIIGQSPWLYLAVILITGVLLLYSYKYPLHRQAHSPLSRAHWKHIWNDLKGRRPSTRARSDEQRLDYLLDKVAREGLHSLNRRERKQLHEISQRQKQS